MRLFLTTVLLLAASAAHAQQGAAAAPAPWGSPTVDNGACCQSLDEVRGHIDRIDHDIVRLMAERGRYVHEAARFKADPTHVEVPARAEAVVRKAMSLAQENGLSPDIAEATYRPMLRAYLDYEQQVFAKASAAGQTPWKK
ncbi:chorismate mutase [Janthinobacterium sp. PC23-8]|uniref:chorismate mutase n=1 Tax=Janthinobacterium sp. PC23-8 TaxID=2012679 RepID=UPI000B96418C|nr:chorismate mutase [Janthinobacterium sp. PC23-8]OYO25855.1 chorismate mutase [Janthinobacterium sp. PC23-8]